MIKTVLIFILGLAINLNDGYKKITVIDLCKGIKFNNEIALNEADTTFTFRGTTYLVQSKEVFDKKGEIINAIIEGDVGYSIYTREHFHKFKNFLNEYGLIRFAEVCIIDDHHIRLNKKIILIKEIDKKKKIIFYSLKDKDVLFRITYK